MKTLNVWNSGDKPEVKLGTAVETGICCCCADPLGVFSSSSSSSPEVEEDTSDSESDSYNVSWGEGL